MRIRKDDFETWYKTQTRYRTKSDRERDAELEESSMTMPEMARFLLISREEAYKILFSGKNKDRFEFVIVGDRRRVTKKSFERWYVGQSKYRKLCDRSPEEINAMERKQQIAEKPRLAVDETKAAFTLQETAVLMDLTYNEVRSLIRTGEIEARKYGTKFVYLYDDEATGKRKQKWESFKSMADAKRRKAEIEYRQELGTMVIHQCKTVDELLKEYVALYGKTAWSMSMYTGNTGLIEHYISPIIGNMKLSEVTARVLEKYYMQLLKTPAVHRITQKKNAKNTSYVAPPTVRKIHNVLRSAFHQAVK